MSQDPFVSYAQNHEDVVLARALHPDRESGFWIDVGAGDPVTDSVTAAFSERGWRGVNIEPLAREFKALCAQRPSDINLCVAVGATSGTATLFEGPDHDRGGSTLRPDIVASHGPDAANFTTVDVPVHTLAELVAEHVHEPVDFLKIDVEGYEYDVIAGADFSEFRPRVLVVEATFPNTTKPSHESWEPLVLEAGYRFAMFDGLNRFYANADEPDLFEALSIPANVLDEYVSHRWIEEFAQATRFAESLRSQLADLEGLRPELEGAHEDIRRAHGDIRRLEADAAVAWKTARYAQDRARSDAERAFVLQDELGAAQMRSALALAEVVSVRAEVDAAQAEIELLMAGADSAEERARVAEEYIDALKEELSRALVARAELEATRTFRYTARVRGSYGRLRRALRL